MKQARCEELQEVPPRLEFYRSSRIWHSGKRLQVAAGMLAPAGQYCRLGPMTSTCSKTPKDRLEAAHSGVATPRWMHRLPFQLRSTWLRRSSAGLQSALTDKSVGESQILGWNSQPSHRSHLKPSSSGAIHGQCSVHLRSVSLFQRKQDGSQITRHGCRCTLLCHTLIGHLAQLDQPVSIRGYSLCPVRELRYKQLQSGSQWRLPAAERWFLFSCWAHLCLHNWQ